MKISKIEKMARAYVEKCGDEAEAMRLANPQIAERGSAELRATFKSLYSKSPTFWRRVTELQQNVEKQIGLKANDLIEQWRKIGFAEVTELSRVVAKVGPCAKCWAGHDGPAHPGPNSGCNWCCGAGLLTYDVEMTPTDELSPTARYMFDGAEMTKHGVKVKHLDRHKALDNLGKALGIFGDSVNNGGGTQAQPPSLPADPVEAARLYHEWIKGL